MSMSDNQSSIAEFGPAPGCTVAKPCQTNLEPIERFGSGHLAQSAGVAVNSTNGIVYVSNTTGDDVEIFPKALVPALTTSEPSGLEKEGSATLNGTVDPEGVELTSCEFEYGPTSSYGSVSPCPAGIVGSKATAELPVSAELSGLAPDTLYHYRLVAGYAGENNVGYSPDQTFVAGALPTIGGESLSGIDSSEATISAQVNPGGLATTYDVRYGPCPEPYEQTVCEAAPYPLSTPEVSAGAGFTATGVQVHLRGLRAGVLYHARIAASNAIVGGPKLGGELVFTTVSSTGPSASSLPDDRAYELVSPVTGRNVYVFVPFGMEGGLTSSGGEHGIITTRESKAAADGNAVVYQGDPPPTGGTGEFQLDRGDDYLATRAAGAAGARSMFSRLVLARNRVISRSPAISPWGSSKPVLSWRRKLRRDTTSCIRIRPPTAPVAPMLLSSRRSPRTALRRNLAGASPLLQHPCSSGAQTPAKALFPRSAICCSKPTAR